MLTSFGYPWHRADDWITIKSGGRLRGTQIDVPGDISSAAFFLVGAAIAQDSDLTLRHVGMNPTRTGVVEILRQMGARLEVTNPRMMGGEPVADLRIRSSRLRGIAIPEGLVPLAIDEFPAIFVAAACAEGETALTGAGELRVKETDRIQVMADGLQALGVETCPTPDGMRIRGGQQLKGGVVDARGDHRIAMALSVAAVRAAGVIEIRDCRNVSTSFPNFIESARSVGLSVTAVEGDVL
jgi:3-phosphoshikimate 1-carboxyvinyltransferase